jgi:hypothetical protein
MRKEICDKIALQSKNEIDEARIYKQGKINSWTLNEAMYYGKKLATAESRASVSLGQMQEFVHTLLSKIDNPLSFKFTKRKPSQLKRVELINSLRNYDANRGFWDLKDIVGKKQAIIYGRSVYAYYASSINGYESNLEPIDVYDFLIDPSASGIDLETAMYMGNWGVVKTKKELKQGVKDGIYSKQAVYDLIESGGNSDEINQEETNKKQRSYDVKTIGLKEIRNENKYKFWQWFTTYEGTRYYVLMDNSGRWIRCEKLEKMFATDIFPYWSWACFPDMTEFWTPSYCDYARELFMAQEVSINQMLDNAEAINKPQKIVRVNDIEDMTKVTKYRKDGIIPVKSNADIDKAIQFVKVPSINTPIEVYNILGSIQDRASGVTAGSAGVADEQGKVGIYEGNQVASADRFGLLNKSYSFGYKRFAKLYEAGVKEHLIKKVAVEILGPNGVEIKNISKRDIYKKGDEFGLVVEASDAEMTNSIRNQSTKLNFLNAQVNNPMVNKTKAFELGAKISGLNEDEVRELLDTAYYGDEELMSEADRDIEALLNGDAIEANEMANNAYKQKMVDYMRDHKEDISNKQYFTIAAYIDSLDEIIIRNEARNFQQEQIEAMKQPLTNPDGTPLLDNPMANPETSVNNSVL